MRFRHLSSAVIYNSVNLPPENLNILANYTLTQGQDTVITAAAVDPEGDAITWSFEEVASGSSYVVVGAYGDDDNGDRSGSVYVYDANDLSAQPTKLTAFDGANVDQFGYSVVATADQIFVGVPYDDSNSGSVYVYDVNDLSAQPTKLTAFDAVAEDYFGVSVAATADKIIVGASYDDDNHTNTGSVYVYDANDLSATPTKLTAFDGAAGDQFGNSVAVAADKIIVGAYLDDDNGSDSGSVYVFDANDLSAQPTKLTAFDGATSDRFGISVAATADKIVVGAYLDDDNGTDSGSVYVYDINDLSAQPTKLTSFDAAAGDKFGEIIATAADKIIVSAPRDDDNGTDSGSVYVYNANDLSAQPTKLTAFDAAVSDQFGSSIAATADKIVVGARLNDDNGTNSGSVYVFDANNLSAQPTKLTAYDGAAIDYFGGSVSANVAPSALNGVTVSQTDNVFTITPGTADANFQLRITATDSEGNATSVTSTFDFDYVNQPPVISDIDASYILTEGQDTVITAVGTDPEGDALTWSFEEVLGGGSGYVVVAAPFDDDNGNNAGAVYVFDTNDLSAQPIKLLAPADVPLLFSYGDITVTADKIIVASSYNEDASGAVYVYDANDLSAEPTKLTAFDGATYDYFSASVSANSDKIVVGASGDDDNGSNSGSVYVYDANNLSAQPTKLTAFDGAADDYFGFSVDASGDKIIVGAFGDDDNGSSSGSVYVYDANDLSVQPTKLTAFDGEMNDSFGRNIHVSADYIFVAGFNNPRGVYVYDANTYSYVTNLAPDELVYDDYVGMSISTNGNKIFVGAYGDDDNGSNSGSVYVYDANDLSAQPTKLTAFDGAANDQFGVSVDASGDKIIVGASNRDDNDKTDSGSVYVFDANDLSATPTKLTAFDGSPNDAFGYRVAITPTSSALNGVTVSQSDNVFTITPGSIDSNFTLRFKVTDAAGNVTTKTSTFSYDYVNKAPIVSGVVSEYNLTQGQDTVITAAATDPEGDAITWSFEEVKSGASYVAVGVPYDDDNGSNSGSVYVYDASDLSAQPTKLTAFDGAADDYFGSSVATTSDKIIVGAPDAEPTGWGQSNNFGAVYVFDANDLSAQPTKLTAFEVSGENFFPHMNDYFGSSVAATADKIVVGAYGDEDNGSNAGAAYVFDANDLSATPTKLTAFDGAVGDGFGYSISTTADKVIVGAYGHESNSGAIYVYDANDLSAQPTKLTAFDGAANDYFGFRISTAADKIVVSAYGDDDNGSNSGSVYVYDANDLSAQPTKLTAFYGAAGDAFGYSVAVTADQIFVGALGDDETGSVYVYDANDLSAQPTKLTAFDAAQYDQFGASVATAADKILVGANIDDDNGTNSGSVYVYDANDLSAQPTKLTAFDGAANDNFGISISAVFAPSSLNGVTVSQSDNVFTVTPGTASADFQLRITATDSEGNATSVTPTFAYDFVNQPPVISNVDAAYTLTQGQDTVITAAATDPEGDAVTWSFEEVMSESNYVIVNSLGDSYAGAVYVYDANDLSVQPTKLTAFDGAANDYFGYSGVAVTADKIIVGAYNDDDNGTDSGSVYVYDINDLSAQPTKLTSFDGAEGDAFGRTVTATADKIVVGATGDDDNGTNSGAAYVYNLNDLSASPTKLTAFDGAAGDNFSRSVAATDDKIFVSAPSDDDNATNSGSVYVFDANDLSAQPTKLTAFDGAANDSFGMSVAATTDKIFVGAYGDDAYTGAIYVYDANDLSASPTKLTAFDGAAGDYFGNKIVTTTDKIFVGAPRNDDNGSVYVYDVNDLSAQPTKLTAYDGDQSDQFGISVAATADKIFVGAYGDDAYTGAVYVFDANDLSAQPTKLTAFDGAGNDYFGVLVAAISASSALNGVTITQSDNVFTVTPGTASADFQLRITATDSEGNATSVTSDFDFTYVNQAPSVAGIDAAYTLTQGQDTVITATGVDPEGDAITWSFEEVMSGSRYIAVTADADDDVASSSGSVYVYDSSDLSAQPIKLSNPEPEAHDRFGYSVSISQNKLVVGAAHDDNPEVNSGSVYVYDLTDLSAAPIKLEEGGADDRFGNSVATNSNYIFITSPNDDDAADEAGAIYVYDINDLTATPTKLTPDNSVYGGVGVDGYVASIDADDNYMVVGAYDDNSFDGAAYVYDVSNLSATPTKLTQSGSSFMGSTVRVFDDVIIVGSQRANSNAGKVYVYDANNLGAAPTVLEANDGISGMRMFGNAIEVNSDYIFVGANAGPGEAFYRFDRSDLSAAPVKVNKEIGDINDGPQRGLGASIRLIDNSLFVGALDSNTVFVYDATDLSVSPTTIIPSDAAAGDRFGNQIAISSLPSGLNGVTVTQSDNVFTVTPGTASADFTLRITATDSEGNATSVTSTFAYDFVNQAPAVAGIDAAYTLTQGQDTVITAIGTDPEGDAITWSFEEVATGTSYVIVGAYADDDNGSNSGSVYVYDANDLSASPTKLTAFDGDAYHSFGNSIAVTADNIVVGAYAVDGDYTGAVYVYDANNLSAQPTKLTAFDAAADDRFGYSVAVNGDKIIVGAWGDNSFTGSVYVFDANDLSAQPTKLTAFDGAANDSFGYSISTTADKIVVGAYVDDDNGSDSGSVYVFDANDLSAQPTKLTAFDGAASDQFGYSISTTADKIVVGARYDDDNGTDSGSVYVYDINDLSAQPTKLTAFDGAENDYFGHSVAATADKIVVGAYGDDDNATNSGSVYVFDANDLSAQPNKLTAFDGAADDYFGVSVSATDDKIIVGAYGDDENGVRSGSVYVYDANDLSAQPAKLTAFDGAADDYFGMNVAAISASSALNGTTVSQSDNVFTITPGTADADFQLRITATDSEGNATSVTSDFTLDYVNQAPVVMGIESAYTLTQGQNTQIVGLATDAEGEDITWSFEEVLGGSSGYVVVAALGDDGYDGSVYIYNSSDLSATPTKLDTPAGATNFFGRDFEIIGDNLIVTADGDDTLGNDAGAAFVYDMTDLSISPTKITAPDGASGNKFGYSVTSSSDKVIISSRAVGKVYVYDANDLTATPTILTGETNDFGDKVTSNSNYIFVSDPFNNHGGNRAGSVYVYDIDSLSLVTEIEHQASTTAYFGKALSANEEKLAVGGWIAGLVYVYDLNNLSSTPETTIYGYASHKFGISVGLSDNKLVVGASDQSKAYVYDLANLPEYANYQDDLNPNSSFYLGRLDPTNEPTSDDKFGYSVSVNNDNIVVGAYGDNNNTGSTYVYDANDLSATPTILTAFDGEEGEYYGSEVVKIFDISPTSALNDTTVAQSDNVFTVTPGMQDADFQLIFKATDTSGNVTSVTSDFDFTYVNQAPVVAGIESSYLLSAGGDAEVITAAGSDVEGDAITWSFEEVMSGSNYVIVGAQRDDDNGNDSGSVYVYDANDLSAQPTKLTAFDGAATDYFGKSVAGGSGKIVVGATGDDDNGSWSGSVYVFDANDLSAQPTKLTAFDAAADDNFGNSVAVAADKIVVGALGENSLFGAVYVYDANDLSAQPTKLTAYDGAAIDTFGYTVAATADKIVVASRLDDDNGSNSGSVYVYDASDLSAQPIKLTAYDGAANDFFGHSVATTADKIIVGAEGDDDNGSDSGSVYVYDANDLSAQPTKLTAFDGAADDYFGSSVATTSDKIIVGAYADDDNGSTSGSVYVYDANDLSAQPTKLTAFDGAADDYFGVSVAATADKVFVGAYLDDDNVSNSGSVYVYDANDLSATPTKLTAFDGAEGDNFGGNLTAISSITSALNDTTVAQSDNVFTVTPGSEATSFSMRFTATDANGNATTTTSAFTVEEPQLLIPEITDQSSFEQVFTSVYDAQAKWDTPNGPAITVRNYSATVSVGSVMAEGNIAVTQGQQYEFSVDISDPNGDSSARIFIQNGGTEIEVGPVAGSFSSFLPASVVFTAATNSITIKIKRTTSSSTDYYKNLTLV